MAEAIAFNEGRTLLINSGLPATCYFLLSTKSIDASTPFVVTDTLAGGVGEITGTGYARLNQAEPTAVAGAVAFTQMTWDTGTATDWPAVVRSCVLASTVNNTGKAICAWNLLSGGAPRAMNVAHTTESFTPSLQLG